MDYIKSLAKSFAITIISIFIASLLLTCLYYFNIISSNIYNVMKLIIFLGAIFINSIIIGKKAKKYGLIEGLKLGGLFIIVMIITQASTKNDFGLKTFIYSIIILYFANIFTKSAGNISKNFSVNRWNNRIINHIYII